MARDISYDDAVRILGGDHAGIQKLLDTLLGAGMLALVGPFRDVLGWFDAKAELSRVTAALVSRLADHRSGLSRYERTQRLEAAHAVIVVTAFFEALAESASPLEHRALELTADEQRSLTGGTAGRTPLGGWSTPIPGPAQPHEAFLGDLAAYYTERAAAVAAFVTGLAAFERLDETARAHALAAVAAVPEPALGRYRSLLGRLATEFPEAGFWAGLREHAATRERLRDLATGLDALHTTLDAIATGRAPDDRRRGLALAYRAAMRLPIAPSGEIPAGLRVPTLAEAFLPQLYRASAVTGQAALSSEDWWERRPVRDDLLAFLTWHLTAPAATAGPLLILGQPGSGKSVLTRVLAAQLPPADFMPVLVVLRAVPAAADLQDQIEYAIRDATGERVEWPALSRSADGALPLIILDGFDELLQATGVSQSDYLQRVARFQRREADQGRPVAVVVTSRTSVADRAQAPEDTIALRLEPFDVPRVAAWLDVWNRANAPRFTGDVHPISLETVLRYPELASQPLLLLMLALYDAEGNALHSAGALRPDQLYERLLTRFALREVEKLGTGLPRREVHRRVEGEMRRLSVVAFAMLNRGAQWVTEEQLQSDLLALPALGGAGQAPASPAGLRAPLRAAELALGSFFFVHRARATRDLAELETYEFLHATFGEFLAARLIHGIVAELVARERVTTFHTGTALDDDLLHALLSFAPLADRRQVVLFLRGLASELDTGAREEWLDVLVGVYRAAQLPRPPRAFDGYAPALLTVPARVAAYTSNLLLLVLSIGPVTASRLVGGESARGRDSVVRAWRQDSRLWRSQPAASGFSGLLDLVSLDRTWTADGQREIALRLTDAPAAAPAAVDLRWALRDVPVRADSMIHLRREAHFTCHDDDDLQQHLNDPLIAARLGPASSNLVLLGDELTTSLSVAFRVLFSPDLPPPQRAAAYRHWAVVANDRMTDLLLLQLAADPHVPPVTVVQVLKILPDGSPDGHARCIAAHLGRHPEADDALSLMLESIIDRRTDTVTPDLAHAFLRACELHPARQSRTPWLLDLMIARYTTTRPDLVVRARSVREQLPAHERRADGGADRSALGVGQPEPGREHTTTGGGLGD
ncbi:hypothetical protein JCM9534A_62090 [Catenuloplanes indicus JCM 9534]|uniref:AAA+ ATPase domain-containing protein n=1 Tax=Catenuloplanes indicus TaxID=137267 RepID=A0AAE4B259_9ACTN|nr:hypothetical protein [Catenuloplanes indicus]